MVATLKAPGQPRAILGLILGAAFGFGLVVALRAISGLEIFQTEQTGYPHVIVPAITGPIGYLMGIGCFDYWFRWASGAPTIPDDHSQHGAHSWKDYFKFNAGGGLVTLTLTDGSQFITPGSADPGATLKSKLTIFDSVGNQVGTGSLDGSTLFSTFSMNLGTGSYFAEITSFGGFSHTGSFGNQLYYDMGSYFLTGSGLTAVPEPGTFALVGLAVASLLPGCRPPRKPRR